MTVELGWWAIPLLLIIVGLIFARLYYVKNYSPGGYIGDFITPAIATAIFSIFAALAFGVVVGWLMR